MSSIFSATIRADSEEPPAKRQKTLIHGPDAVVLRVDTPTRKDGDEDGETIAIVNATKFHKATQGRLKGSEASMTHHGRMIKDASLSVIIFSKDLGSVIRVLAHWISEGCIDAAVLKACVEDGAGEDRWVYLIFQVIEFWLRNDFDT
ncbi:hypothetical protein KCU98_g2106, partial [Aureobasidium melanogenum]